MAEPFIGEIRMFTCDYAPRDWAFCDGQELAISQNTALFSIISDTYGGDGRTTMALPDLRGRSPMNPRRGAGLSYRWLGQVTGSPTVILDESHLPSHNHTVTAVKAGGITTNPTGQYLSKMADNYLYKKEATNPAAMHYASIKSAGQGQPHYNSQPLTVVNFCIALDGIYPPRS